jgi:hypothetical protein
MRRIGLLSALALVLALGWSVTADALQLVPTATSRLHTITSGQPGAQWNTTGGALLDYDSGTGVATLTANLDVLNWFDTANGACATDAGSNCSYNYGPDLSISLDAAYVGAVTTPVAPNLVNITLNFQTTANALPDLTVSDPTDLPFGPVLEGVWQSGLYNGNPTLGLSFSMLFNTATMSVASPVNGAGFLAIDSSTAYAGLFESGANYFGLQVGTLSDFGGTYSSLNAIVAHAIANAGALPDFTAEAIGQVYRVTAGDFVIPEPATAILLAGGLALLGARRRS